MPVIVDPADYETWLNPEVTDIGRISDIVHATKICNDLTLHPVSDPANFDRDLRAAAAQSQTPLFDSLAD
jgi:putative SOS response-associated peptidase YedK